MRPCSLLTLLLLSLLLPACTSPSPAAPTLAISGPIVDAAINKPVVAVVYMDGKLTLSKTDHLELAIPLQSDQQTEIRVKAPGCKAPTSQPRGFAVYGGALATDERPVRAKARAKREMPSEWGTFTQAPKASQPGAVQRELGL